MRGTLSPHDLLTLHAADLQVLLIVNLRFKTFADSPVRPGSCSSWSATQRSADAFDAFIVATALSSRRPPESLPVLLEGKAEVKFRRTGTAGLKQRRKTGVRRA